VVAADVDPALFAKTGLTKKDFQEWTKEIKDDIKNKLAIDFGQTSEDGEFTLIPVPCLGDCDRAPVMMVGEELHRNLTPEKM